MEFPNVKTIVGKRIQWIDAMKVLGMYFIIAGHYFPPYNKYIYAFSVPLFFFISGYLFKKKDSIPGFISTTIIYTVLPTFILILAVHGFNALIFGQEIKALPLLWGIISGNQEYLLTGWFVYTLIILRSVFQFFNIKSIIYYLLPLSVVLSIVLNRNELFYYNAIPDALPALPFFLAGTIIRTTPPIHNTLILNILRLKYIIFPVLFVLLLLATDLNGTVFLYINNYGNNYLLYIVGASSGIVLTYLLSRLTPKFLANCISLLSEGNLLVLLTHIPLMMLLSSFGIHFSPAMKYIGAVLIYVAYFPIIYTLKIYCPFILGLRKKKYY